jgi:hypothetical protein
MYFRQLDALTITVSTARDFDDHEWFAFLEDTLAVARDLRVTTKVSMVCSVYAHPNARQRKAMSDFFARHRLEKLERIALVTDNVLVRGALTAFGWIVPKVRVSAFRSSDAASGFQWLREAAPFPESAAMLAWEDALTTLGLKPGVSIRVDTTRPDQVTPIGGSRGRRAASHTTARRKERWLRDGGLAGHELALRELSLEAVPVRSSAEFGKHGHDAEANADDEKEVAR